MAANSTRSQNLSFLVGLGVLGVIVVALLAFFGSRSETPDSNQTQLESQQAEVPAKLQDRYQDYSPAAFASAQSKKRVLFFYAAWCPTCRPADKAFRESLDQIPEDVMLFRVNYDTETQLKQQYGITYQHTYVYVDSQGNEIRKWNGGQLQELITNTRS